MSTRSGNLPARSRASPKGAEAVVRQAVTTAARGRAALRGIEREYARERQHGRASAAVLQQRREAKVVARRADAKLCEALRKHVVWPVVNTAFASRWQEHDDLLQRGLEVCLGHVNTGFSAYKGVEGASLITWIRDDVRRALVEQVKEESRHAIAGWDRTKRRAPNTTLSISGVIRKQDLVGQGATAEDHQSAGAATFVSLEEDAPTFTLAKDDAEKSLDTDFSGGNAEDRLATDFADLPPDAREKEAEQSARGDDGTEELSGGDETAPLDGENYSGTAGYGYWRGSRTVLGSSVEAELAVRADRLIMDRLQAEDPEAYLVLDQVRRARKSAESGYKDIALTDPLGAPTNGDAEVLERLAQKNIRKGDPRRAEKVQTMRNRWERACRAYGEFAKEFPRRETPTYRTARKAVRDELHAPLPATPDDVPHVVDAEPDRIVRPLFNGTDAHLFATVRAARRTKAVELSDAEKDAYVQRYLVDTVFRRLEFEDDMRALQDLDVFSVEAVRLGPSYGEYLRHRAAIDAEEQEILKRTGQRERLSGRREQLDNLAEPVLALKRNYPKQFQAWVWRCEGYGHE